MNRDTPSPSPGEWEPVDRAFTLWKLVCTICGREGPTVQAPIGKREHDEIRNKFITDHQNCLNFNA